MKAKIISFPFGHFERKKQYRLTLSMINTLLDACEKQHAGTPYGPADIKGSFSVLITRGLIVQKEVNTHGHIESMWQVTAEAIGMLKDMGIKVAC